MTVNVTVDVDELEAIIKIIDSRSNTVPVSTIAEQMLADIDDLIQSEGGGSWEDFAPATLLRHPRRIGGKLLQDTLELGTIQYEAGLGTFGDYIEVFSPAPYAKYHRTGTKYMPKRDFLDIDMDKSLEEAADIWTSVITG
jgi:hypothetical protein